MKGKDMAEENEVKHAAGPDQMTLALERTYLAHERTMMAWTRTATSLIAFGFTLFKFFDYLHDHQGAESRPHLIGAKGFGLIMIGIGVFTLVLATLQHWVQMNRLCKQYPNPPYSLAFVLASLIASLGVLGFITGIVR